MLLKKGDHNTNVALWQGFLNSQGFSKVIADASFGPETERATIAFQRMCVLRDDGIVGDATIAHAKLRGFAGFNNGNTAPQPPAQPQPPVPIETKNLAKLDAVHPTLKTKVTALINRAAAEGYTLRVIQGLRTVEEQEVLYAQGRTRPGLKVTNAKGGASNHNYGLAVDLAFIVDGEVSWEDGLYHKLGGWAAKCGLAWGGNWKHSVDMPHVELPNIPNWRMLFAEYEKGGLDAVWKDF
jgi:hypothetical protein